MSSTLTITDLADRRLSNTHSTLWGQAFDLSQSESREKAVKFLAAEVEATLLLARGNSVTLAVHPDPTPDEPERQVHVDQQEQRDPDERHEEERHCPPSITVARHEAHHFDVV